MRAILKTALVLIACGSALAACSRDEREGGSDPAEVVFADETAPPAGAVLDVAPEAPPAADAAAGLPSEPVPYDQLKAQGAPPAKKEPDSENVFY